MSDPLYNKRFPGESDEYREARNKLPKAGMELRKDIGKVAELRRLPPAGRQGSAGLCV